MKKTIVISVLTILILASMIILAACSAKSGEGEDTTAENSGEITTVDQTHGTPDKDKSGFDFQKDLTTLTEADPAKASETVSAAGYTAETSGEAWSVNSGIDYSVYDYTGSGKGLIDTLMQKHRNAKKNYYLYDASTEKSKMLDVNKVSTLSGVLAFFKKKDSTVNVYIQIPELRVQPEFKAVSGRSGYYLPVSFKTNVPGTFVANVSKRAGSRGGYLPEDGEKSEIVAEGKNGTYVGVFNATVPFVDPGKYYINICSLSGDCLATVPIEISASKYSALPYHLVYAGPWDKIIKREEYMEEITKLFYTTYPRLIARWGNGGEPETITFWIDPAPEGVAYAWGTNVAVVLNYANENPGDIGFFSHEITHSVQQYNGFESEWWTENMATYGGFRYFHWSNLRYVQIYDVQKNPSLTNWGFNSYGDGCQVFFSYLDHKWPSKLDEDGNLVYGLVDAINFGIKEGKIKEDDPDDVNSAFNKTVKEITGFDCMEDLRKSYAAECKAAEWKFVGFADYEDNFITEDLPDVPNAVYPKITEAVHGGSGEQLKSAVTEGDNILSGATVVSASGQVNSSEAPEKLIDGNFKTKWCCTGATDSSYCLDGAKFWIIIDLGSKQSFNTYTIYNTKTQETGGNTCEWELLISDDLENWTSFDYQNVKGGGGNIASFEALEKSARYLMLKVYNGDGNYGTVRLYELQLYHIY